MKYRTIKPDPVNHVGVGAGVCVLRADMHLHTKSSVCLALPTPATSLQKLRACNWVLRLHASFTWLSHSVAVLPSCACLVFACRNNDLNLPWWGPESWGTTTLLPVCVGQLLQSFLKLSKVWQVALDWVDWKNPCLYIK